MGEQGEEVEMMDRQTQRNAIIFGIGRRGYRLPQLSNGKRNIHVVFNDEKVGPALRTVQSEYDNFVHIVVVTMDDEKPADLRLLTLDGSSTSKMEADRLSSSITFGTLLSYARDVHDGVRPVQFVFDDTPVAATESEVPDDLRELINS